MNDLSQALAALLVYFAVSPITYTAISLQKNVIAGDKQCETFINPGMTSRITEWLIPGVFAAAILFPSSGRGRQFLLSLAAFSIALFYGNIVTASCPEEWTITPLTWAHRDNIALGNGNHSVIFLPQAAEFQWRASVVFTALAAALLLISIKHPKESKWYEFRMRSKPDMHAQLMLLLSLAGAIILLADAPTLDKLDASIYCRGGQSHPAKVFDTTNTGFGPLSGRSFDLPASLTLVFSVLALFFCNRVATVCSFISTGITLSMMQYTLQNPGCTTAIHGLSDITTQTAAVFLSYAWLAHVLCLMPIPDTVYCELKSNF